MATLERTHPTAECDNISNHARLAREAGMSYGKWMAIHRTGPIAPKVAAHVRLRAEACGICGAQLPRCRKKYCSDHCQAIGKEALARERYRRRKEAAENG